MPVIHPAPHARVTGWATVTVTTALLAAMGACSTKPQCKVDGDCGTGRACVKQMCLDRGVRTLAFEITPPIDSLAATTEISGLTSEAMIFPVDPKVSVKGTVARPAPDDEFLYVGEAHVIVAFPSLIPGRAPLSLPQAEMANFTFDFGIGKSRLGGPANLTFSPGSRARYQPPISLTTTLAPELEELRFPTNAQMTGILGTLEDANSQPLTNYVVRVWVDSTLASNWGATNSSGDFGPFVPPGVLTSTTAVVLTMDPTETPKPEDMPSVPHYLSSPFVPPAALSPSRDTGELGPHRFKMPAYTSPTQPTSFVVVAGEEQAPQSNVTVLFRAEIPSPPDGMAVYQTSAMTDKDGLVQVPLIADGLGGALAYQVVLQPPNVDDYLFASRCMPSVPIDPSQANAAQPTILTMDTKRSVLGGHVFGKGSSDADVPVADAQVTATQIFEAGACTDAVAPSPAMTFTDAKGSYVLRVDPGTYRIDVIPPATSQWPRITQDGDSAAVVDASFVQRDITLPQGEVVDGTVMDADGMAVPNATVRIFQTDCKTTDCSIAGPPSLLAEVRTDAVSDGDKKVVGTFRAVLPPR